MKRLLFLPLVLLLACGDSPPISISASTVGWVSAPGFALRDENPNTSTYHDFLSPSDYSGKISAWYFAKAG
tara:strand:+ start:136 stop:348 length:213 start_codon:yes stop_codon:yes gene_type:complete